jgi:hypothetical protein
MAVATIPVWGTASRYLTRFSGVQEICGLRWQHAWAIAIQRRGCGQVALKYPMDGAVPWGVLSSARV